MPRPLDVSFSLSGCSGLSAQMSNSFAAMNGALNPLGLEPAFRSIGGTGLGGAATGGGSGTGGGGGGGSSGSAGGGPVGSAGVGFADVGAGGGSSGSGSGGRGSNGGGDAGGGGVNGGFNPNCGPENNGAGGSGSGANNNCMTCQQVNACDCDQPDVPGKSPGNPQGFGCTSCTCKPH